ncbi:hypothetical protein ACN27G_19410 [Plantactinospora sp. WMMB334]|uniref:hypothetical protein n=1 Tax=Plantactinospora sp. WMMB334 TaxID=3404119 RepID=UPI003B92F352
MTIPLTPRIMDAICLDHVVPTNTGVHLQVNPQVGGDGGPLLAEANDLPGIDGITYLSLGDGMIDAAHELAPAAVHWQDGIRTAGEAGTATARRARTLLYQFLRGIPPVALERMVERPLGEHGLSLADAAARADAIGLPVYVTAADLRSDDAGERPSVNPNRILAFDREMRLVPSVEDAYIIGVVPGRHWAPDPYAGLDDEIVAEVLGHPYPPGRMVFDDGQVRLGLPASLTDRAHARPLREFGRPLVPDDLARTGTPVTRVGGYGELLARMAATDPGAYALVAVDGPDGATSVYLGVHDAHGVAFLDLGAGRAAVFPQDPGQIQLAQLSGDAEILTVLRDLGASRPVDPAARQRPAAPPSGVRLHRQVGRDGAHAVELIGEFNSVPKRLLEQVTTAARDGELDVIVIGGGTGKQPGRPSARPGRRELLNLEMRLFQYLGSDALPAVVATGDVDQNVLDVLDRYHVPLLRRTVGAAGGGPMQGGGLSLNLDNLWEARGPQGRRVDVPPQKDVTGALLRAATGQRPPADLRRPPARLLSYLSVPLENTTALRAELTEHGTALRHLRPQIEGLGVQRDVFAAHDAFLRMTERNPDLVDAAFDYLGADAASRFGKILSAVPTLAAKEPEARRTAFEDMASITRGTTDDGASRAILSAIGQRIEGASPESVRKEIFRHSAYLPRSGRNDLLSTLKELVEQMPEHRAALNEVAIYVADCP